MPAKTDPLGNVLWTVRKGGSPRQHELPPAPVKWTALFPEFEIGAPVTQGGDQVLYLAQVKAGLSPCLLLFIESSEFFSPEHRTRFLAGMAIVQAVTHPNLLSLLWIGEREGHVCLGYEALSGDSLYDLLDHFTLDRPTVVGIARAPGRSLGADSPSRLLASRSESRLDSPEPGRDSQNDRIRNIPGLARHGTGVFRTADAAD